MLQRYIMDKTNQQNLSAHEDRLNNTLNERLGRIGGHRRFLLGSNEEVKTNQISWINTYWGHDNQLSLGCNEDKNGKSNHIGQ